MTNEQIAELADMLDEGQDYYTARELICRRYGFAWGTVDWAFAAYEDFARESQSYRDMEDEYFTR